MLVAVTLTAQSPPRNDEVRFEVASVKPSSMPPQADRIWQVTPTRFTARNVPLRDYLVWAFDTDWRRLVTPSSFQNQRFDIAATGTTLNGQTLRAALRLLLEERFTGSIGARMRAPNRTSSTTRRPLLDQRLRTRLRSRASRGDRWRCVLKAPHCAPRVAPEHLMSVRCSSGSDRPYSEGRTRSVDRSHGTTMQVEHLDNRP